MLKLIFIGIIVLITINCICLSDLCKVQNMKSRLALFKVFVITLITLTSAGTICLLTIFK